MVVGGLGSFIVLDMEVGACVGAAVDGFGLDVITGVVVGGVGVSRKSILL